MVAMTAERKVAQRDARLELALDEEKGREKVLLKGWAKVRRLV